MKKSTVPFVLLFLGIVLFGLSFVFKGTTSGDIDVKIVKTSAIMPAAHNVYANPDALDGQYYLFKAKITNNTNNTLEDVTIRYRIPGYIDWTELDVIGEMFKGQTASVRCYPKFKDDITEKMTESVEKAEIEISWDGAKDDDIIEEEFSFRMTDRNEYLFTHIPAEEIAGWSDVFSNGDLLACYVTPNDPIVKYYTQNIQEKILMGESASVDKKPEEAIRFLKGIYNASILSHMVYSGTKGIPESLQDVSKLSQHNRLPREVITGNTGLCLELSLLYASVLSIAGLDPVIFLIPGHAYPGFKLNGQYYAIEATAIGGEGLGKISTADEALQKGMEELGTFIKMAQNGDPRYSLVDIHAVNQQGVTPMVLKDDEFLRNKVDDIVASWSGGGINQGNVTNNTYIINDNDNNRNNNNRGGNLPFSVPGGWQTIMNPVPQMPILTAQVIAPDQMTSIAVYDVPVSTVDQAMGQINQYFSSFGINLQYQSNGNNLSGYSQSADGTFQWIGKALRGANGIRIVAVGAPDYIYQQNAGIINQIYNSIR
jgi:hypothetical protein